VLRARSLHLFGITKLLQALDPSVLTFLALFYNHLLMKRLLSQFKVRFLTPGKQFALETCPFVRGLQTSARLPTDIFWFR
jgi:hypothetical protein